MLRWFLNLPCSALVYYLVENSLTLAPHSAFIEVSIHHEDQCHASIGHPGDFLFQFLPPDHGIVISEWSCFDARGRPCRWDEALYQNQTFRLERVFRGRGGKTDQVLQHVLRDGHLQLCLEQKQAVGSAPSLDEGLDDVTIYNVMRILFEQAKDQNIFWISPRTAAHWIDCPAQQAVTEIASALADFDGDRVVLLLGTDGHWAVLDYQMFDCGAEITYVDGIEDRLLSQVEQIGTLIHLGFGFGPFGVTQASCYCQAGGAQCGAVALLHLGWRLGLWSSFSASDVMTWYGALRWGPTTPSIVGTGPLNAPAQKALHDLLVQKGASTDQVDERIAAALKTFGKEKIEHALKQRNSWQALKSLGSSRPKPFMWISSNELQAHIENQGRSKWGADVDIKKTNRAGKGGTPQGCEQLIDPTKLKLPPGHWVFGDDVLPQVEFSSLPARGQDHQR